MGAALYAAAAVIACVWLAIVVHEIHHLAHAPAAPEETK